MLNIIATCGGFPALIGGFHAVIIPHPSFRFCYNRIMTKKDPSSADPQDDLAAKVAAAAAQDSKYAELEKKIEDLNGQLKAMTEAAARAQAELLNAKSRLEREAGDMRKFAAEAVLMKLLPVIDNLQRAIKHLPEDLKDNEWVKGVIATEQQLLKQVGEMGLIRFESLGEPLDPARHEVLMQGAGKENTVTDVIEDGYELHGKVVRPAKVKSGSDSAA